jgi:hypothetical protein
MTKSTKTSPLSKAWAFIARIGDVIRAPVGEVAANSHGTVSTPAYEKISASDPTLTPPSNTPRGKPHGIRHSVQWAKVACI